VGTQVVNGHVTNEVEYTLNDIDLGISDAELAKADEAAELDAAQEDALAKAKPIHSGPDGSWAVQSDQRKDYGAVVDALNSAALLYEFGGSEDAFPWRNVRTQEEYLGKALVDDALLARIKLWCLRNVCHMQKDNYAPLVASVQSINEAITALADARQVDEVANYLCKQRGTWDGVERLTSGFADAIGLGGQDEPLAAAERSWVRRWMISAVARALSPGCQADSALVLQGPQGAGKSSLLRLLFGVEHLHDSPIEFGTKDGASVMSKAWCVELAELASIRRAKDVETVKHFLTLRVDKYRPPYGRREVALPRRAVVAGSTNEPMPLADPTGNRRFWVVRVQRAVDLEWVKAHREQLWAETVALFDAGEPWHLTREEADFHQQVTAERYVQHDEWEEMLRRYVANLGPEQRIPLMDAADALGIKPEAFGRPEQYRVAQALRALGMEQVRTKRARLWQKIQGEPQEHGESEYTHEAPQGDAW